jgi:GT2 family glycosyltransferase
MISLIVTTRNRVDELHRLFASLEAQTYRSFEVIVVDQNVDHRLVEVLARHPSLNIRHLHSGPGASCGRNAGLRAFGGDLVAFPDDDCWYPTDLLADVVQWFHNHPDYDGLLTGCRNPAGKLMAPKFPPRKGPCSKHSILRCAIAWNIFLRHRAAKTVGFFREEMGPGALSPYQSGEDLDYPIRALKHGFRLWYAPDLTVHHPELNSRARLAQTNHAYAMSMGRVWRLHKYSWGYCLGEIAFRSLGGAAFHLCRGDRGGCRLYLERAAGQFRGYLQPIEPLTPAEKSRAMGSRGA